MLIYKTTLSGIPDNKFFVDIDTLGACSEATCRCINVPCSNCVYRGYAVLYPIEVAKCNPSVERVVNIYRKNRAR